LLDSEGRLLPAAKTVFNDLYRFTLFYKNAPADPQGLALIEGSRSTVRHMLKKAGLVEIEAERNLTESISGDD